MAAADPPRLTPHPANSGRERSVRPPAGRLGVLAALRRLAARDPRRTRRRARDGPPRADRPGRAVRGRALRPGLPAVRDRAHRRGRSRLGADPRRAAHPDAVRGGASRDATSLACASWPRTRQGWAQLCRLISASAPRAASGDTRRPRWRAIAEAAAHGHLRVLLGADSDLGVAVAAGSTGPGRGRRSGRWSGVGRARPTRGRGHPSAPGRSGRRIPDPRGPDAGPGRPAGGHGGADQRGPDGRSLARSDRRRAGCLPPARRPGPPARRPGQRRGVPEVGEGDAAARRRGGPARRVAGERGGRRLLAATRAVALSCVLDPEADLGLGRPHLPELVVAGAAGPDAGSGTRPRAGRRRWRCSGNAASSASRRRYGELERGAAARRRADRLADELAVVDRLGLRLVLPHRGRHRRADRRARHPLRRPGLRGRQLDQLRPRDLRRRAAGARSADGTVPCRSTGGRCPTSTSTWSPNAGPRSTR